MLQRYVRRLTSDDRLAALALVAAAALLAGALFLPWSRSTGLDALVLFGALDEFGDAVDGLERSAWEEWRWFDVALAAVAGLLALTAALDVAGRPYRHPAIAACLVGIVAVVGSFAIGRDSSDAGVAVVWGGDFVPAAAGPLLALAALGLALRALTSSGPPDLHERGSYALLVGAGLLLAMTFAPWTEEPGAESHFSQDADSFSGGVGVWADTAGWIFEGTPWVAVLFVGAAVALVAAAERRSPAGPERLGRHAAVLAAAGAAVALSPWLTWARLDQPQAGEDLFQLDLDGWVVLGRTGWVLLLGGAAIALCATARPHRALAVLPAALALLVLLDGMTVAGVDSSPRPGVFVLAAGLIVAFGALLRGRPRTTL
jgi:hypothetical protein